MSGRGKSDASMALIEAAQEILAEIAPSTVRAVAYQLFNRKLIPDMSKSSTKRVSEQLVWARENDLIDWDDIVDETRAPEYNTGWISASGAIKSAVATYRRDNWQEQPNRLLVISEKGTVAGTLRPVLEEYGVDLVTMHGFGSATALHDLAEMTHGTRPLVMLYVGDFDPSGMHMSEVDLPQRLAEYGAADDVHIQRVALDADDLDDLGDACFSAHDKKGDEHKKGDARYRWFIENHGVVCAELDALSPAVLRARLEAAIQSYMDMDAWNHSLTIEAAEIESMQKFHQQWNSTLNQ